MHTQIEIRRKENVNKQASKASKQNAERKTHGNKFKKQMNCIFILVLDIECTMYCLCVSKSKE